MQPKVKQKYQEKVEVQNIIIWNVYTLFASKGIAIFKSKWLTGITANSSQKSKSDIIYYAGKK